MKCQTALKSRSAYMAILMRVTLKSQTTFKIFFFTWRFQCGNFQNYYKTLSHMCKWYILINANLIDAKQMLRYCLLFNNSSRAHAPLVVNFNDSAQLYFTVSIYCLHVKLTAVWNFTLVKLTEVKFAPK